MHTLHRVLLDLGLLGVLSIGIGFGVNAVRERGAIKPTKNYFERTAQAPSQPKAEIAQPAVIPSHTPSAARDAMAAVGTPNTAKQPEPAKAATTKHLQHEYQEIEFPEVLKVFHSPATAQGLNLFVDARKPDLYEEGHIPGAMRCDPYEPDDALNGIVARANGVERVIVYCGGGDCEDSIFLCRELIEAGLPYDSVFLYPGGWTEWSAKEMPAEVGGREQ